MQKPLMFTDGYMIPRLPIHPDDVMTMNRLKMIREKVEHLVYIPRFNDDELNYTVLGTINGRAEEILILINDLIEDADAHLKVVESLPLGG